MTVWPIKPYARTYQQKRDCGLDDQADRGTYVPGMGAQVAGERLARTRLVEMTRHGR
jgi:hypothetical protein